MRVALIGATGRGGSCILTELVDRGHKVSAIVRHPESVSPQDGVTPTRGDVLNGPGLTQILRGHNAVVVAVQFLPMDSQMLIDAVKTAAVPRLLVMGGAASLEVAPGVKLIDSPQFPREYEPEARKAIEFLALLKKESVLDWTYFSPALLIEHGPRTGKFRLGGDKLVTDAQGNSRITFEDYAIAMVDELEQHAHSRQRFTIAY